MAKRVNEKKSVKEIGLGDKVFVKVNVRNELNYKLGPKFEGPYKVIECMEANKYRVQKENSTVEKVVHLSNMKLVKKKVIKKVRFNLPDP